MVAKKLVKFKDFMLSHDLENWQRNNPTVNIFTATSLFDNNLGYVILRVTYEDGEIIEEEKA
jgi:hypothetical protein